MCPESAVFLCRYNVTLFQARFTWLEKYIKYKWNIIKAYWISAHSRSTYICSIAYKSHWRCRLWIEFSCSLVYSLVQVIKYKGFYLLRRFGVLHRNQKYGRLFPWRHEKHKTSRCQMAASHFSSLKRRKKMKNCFIVASALLMSTTCGTCGLIHTQQSKATMFWQRQGSPSSNLTTVRLCKGYAVVANVTAKNQVL